MVPMVSTAQFASKLGVSPRRVRQLCHSGRLPRARLEQVGRVTRWLIPIDSDAATSDCARAQSMGGTPHTTSQVRVLKPIFPNPTASRKRLAEGRAQAQSIISEMARRGVAVELFGSMRTGTSHPHSDIDLLVTDCGGFDPEMVVYEIGLLEQSIPVDVTILELVPPHSRNYVLESARG